MDTAVQSYATSHCDEKGYAGRIDVVTASERAAAMA